MKAAPLFQDRYRTARWEDLEVDGKIPPALAVTIHRVGVGTFSLFGQRHHHWFDGDGCVVRLQLENGRARGALSLLDCTPELEKRANEKIFGRFGSAPKTLGRRLRSIFDGTQFVNSANTSAVAMKDRLFALFEAGLPTEFDRRTLERVGPESFDGQIPRAFSAHPKWHPVLECYFNFGVRFFPRPSIDLFQFSSAADFQRIGSVPYCGAAFVHDFALTQKYAVFLSSPLFVDFNGYILQAQGLSDSFVWRPESGVEILIVSLGDPRQFTRLKMDAEFVTHFINAHERSDREIVVEAVAYPDAEDMERIGQTIRGTIDCPVRPGKPVRWVIDLGGGGVRREAISSRSAEVPMIHPTNRGAPTQKFSAASYRNPESEKGEVFDAVALVDLQNGTERVFDAGGDTLGEAVWMLSGLDEYLCVQGYSVSRDRSYFSILAVKDNLEEVARIWFPDALPFTFHGIVS